MELFSEKISIKETNVLLKVDNPKLFKIAKKKIIDERLNLEKYISKNPVFLTTYSPFKISNDAPEIVKLMANSSENANVGPMAAVAGTFSELVIHSLLENNSKSAICENGGDIALSSDFDIIVGLYAGNSPISGNLGFKLKKEKIKNGYGVCTSSGTVGHSVSFGNADSVTVFAKSASIADAAATSIGNFAVGSPDEAINKCLEQAENILKIDGVFVTFQEYAGKVGKIPTLIRTEKKEAFGNVFEMV
ncbi:protein of unknown function DUF375 [Methanococcus vannielii SB]|jgi:ApbE superfamily uncharacterized protein (UPF0280 family)|uniref:UPF0280 protein Mevan_0550 n=1 Tax=Methanococcus vannielii (strain ATCC 35089 / DSM 1224 / JCM 13029 / OCM 148 / SB) TaxID=406327 RepID=Y550_METVS|nr:UPF0280 family protein [Methanococcus vannielii]A6UPN5.1 RecName: Full=UPF0280 protein Mevan_0550 [Methanococcus vannielii SB]ABR54457.1 protein of unknown function DUF375 [Methanococcus vannielii SB]